MKPYKTMTLREIANELIQLLALCLGDWRTATFEEVRRRQLRYDSLFDELDRRQAEPYSNDQLWHALNESVKLQSHYAGLLNQYDGGKRMGFADGSAWMQRLAECEAKQRASDP